MRYWLSALKAWEEAWLKEKLHDRFGVGLRKILIAGPDVLAIVDGFPSPKTEDVGAWRITAQNPEAPIGSRFMTVIYEKS